MLIKLLLRNIFGLLCKYNCNSTILIPYSFIELIHIYLFIRNSTNLIRRKATSKILEYNDRPDKADLISNDSAIIKGGYLQCQRLPRGLKDETIRLLQQNPNVN